MKIAIGGLLFISVFLASGDIWAEEVLVRYGDGLVSPNAVQPLEGRFLLIRNGTKLCALRFSEILRRGDAKAPTAFNSGEETIRAHYVWYEGQRVEDKWFITPPLAEGVGEVVKKAAIGVGRLAFGGGDIHIKCGSIRVKWSPPAHVYFYEYTYKDEGNEIAVTQHTRIEEIDPNDMGLHWLRLDNTRKPYSLSTSEGSSP